MPDRPLRALVGVLAFIAVAAWPAAAHAVSIFASQDTQRAVIIHHDQLLPADTDDEDDFYLFENGNLSLVSVGPKGGNGDFDAGFAATSPGTALNHVFFRTEEQMVDADSDAEFDVYRRDFATSTTTLMTPGTASDVSFGVASDDGTKFAFVTSEALTGDTDLVSDVYLSDNGTISLLTPKQADATSRGVDSFALQINSAGTRVFFTSNEELTDTDTDELYGDVYEWSGGSLKLVSTGPNDAHGTVHASLVFGLNGRIGDGEGTFFTSTASLTGEGGGVFRRTGTTTTRWPVGNGSPNTNAAGTQLIFNSTQQLGDGDTDNKSDVYLSTAAGTFTRISKGIGGGNGPHDTHFWGSSGVNRSWTVFTFTTAEPLGAGDNDTNEDVYRWDNGAVTLVSTGPQAQSGTFSAVPDAISEDGSHVYFTTNEQLVPEDTDTEYDIYSRAGTATTLISTGPGQNGPADQASSIRPSTNGSRVFFITGERLVFGDDDDEDDVYLRLADGTVSLVSGSQVPPPPRPVGEPIAPPGANVSREEDGRPVYLIARRGRPPCVTLSFDVPIASGAGTLSAVRMLLDPKGAPPPMQFDMTDIGSGRWRASGVGCVPDGESDLIVCYDLTENTEKQTFCIPVGGIVLIDPQGVVYDKQTFDAARAGGASEEAARNSAAIRGATVVLQRRNGSAFSNVLSGDPGIAPNVNPQVTGADGLFRWDVSAGTYRVVVTASGYNSVTSREVVIPPPVLDLHIAMTRTGSGAGGGGGGAGGGGGTPAPPASPPARPPVTLSPGDRTAPTVRSCSAKTVRPDRRRRVRVCVLPSEAASGTVALATARARRRRGRPAPLSLSLKPVRFRATGARRTTVALTLSRRQASALRRARRATVTLTVVAVDAAGNRGRTTLRLTLAR